MRFLTVYFQLQDQTIKTQKLSNQNWWKDDTKTGVLNGEGTDVTYEDLVH